MLDLSKYTKKTFTEEEARRCVENMAVSFAIEEMSITEAEKQVVIDLLTGKISEEEYHNRFK